MTDHSPTRRAKPRFDARAWTAAIAGLCISATAGLAQTVPIETITVTAKRGNTAADVAPSSTPLEAIEPTSVVSQDFIAKNLPLSGNYDEAIKFSPSVFDTAPNGPGLAESQNISIRGFQDGQFNVTFDGIPWGDANDFTHHSTSYFMSHDLGEVSVDRGPGTAATIGNATFGGTVGLLSKAPSDEFSVDAYGSYGSFNTAGYGTELDTGTLATGTRVLLDAEGLNSDGYLTNLGQSRRNVVVKAVQPIGDNTTLTGFASYNNVHQDISLGATRAEISAFGPNYGLSRDPSSQNYYRYNVDYIATNFEYLDLASNWGDGWSLDAKVYAYAYFHRGLNGEDPNGEFPNGTSLGPNDVPGQQLTNDYRSVGTIARLTKSFRFLDVQAGVWYDHQDNKRKLIEVDFTQHQAPNLDPNTGAPNGIDRELHQVLQTAQPYLQLDLKPIQDLVLTAGVRYSYFDRSVNAVVNVKTGAPQSYDNPFHAYLPSFEARYSITPRWSAYAQAAQGFLAPNENFFNRTDPNGTTLKPQTSWNYQIGTTVKLPRLALSFDAYLIDFTNLITGTTVGGQTVFTNIGGVTYKGVEAEGTYTLGHGLNLYANGTINRAKDNMTGLWIPNAPDTTGALGLIYDRNGIYASILAKYIGARYGDVGQTQGLSPITTADASFGYDLENLGHVLRGAKLKLNINNITNQTKIINLAGYTVGAGTPLYWTQPGRSAFFAVELKF